MSEESPTLPRGSVDVYTLGTTIGTIRDVVFSRDGTRLIAASVWWDHSHGATLSVVDLSDGTILRKKILPGTAESFWARIAVSRDGQRLALACDCIAAYTYDENFGDFYESTDPTADFEAMGYGGLLAAMGAVAGDRYHQRPRDSKRPRRLRFGEHKARSVSFSPDGATLAVGLTDRCVLLETTDYTIRHRDLYSPDAVAPPPLEDEPNPVETEDEPIQCCDGTTIPRAIAVDNQSAAERREGQFVGAAPDVVVAVAFASTSNILAAATTSGVTIFGPSSGTKLYDLVLPTEDSLVDLAYRM